MKKRVHLVGSLGLPDVDTVFHTLSEHLGELAPYYPDGESGVRTNWVGWQGAVFANHPDFEPSGTGPTGQPLFALKPDAEPEKVVFEKIGYAAEAIGSYARFKQLKADGVIPPATRFQVCLPTPTAVISTFVAFENRVAIEAPYTRVMMEELSEIVGAIPLEDLVIQWDIAIEVIAYAGALPLHYGNIPENTVNRVVDFIAAIPDATKVGIHLCYGDPGHKHVVEPTDLGNCVTFANLFNSKTPDRIDYIHMPVPRERNDDSYFAPLSGLDIGTSRLVLGLVHHTDGADGTRLRMATAARHTDDYDIATECGFGRRPENTIAELLDIHQQVLA